MRWLIILFSVFTVNLAYSQDSVSVVTRDTAELHKEIKNICKELKIPYNPDANRELLIFVLDWRGTSYRYGGRSKSGTDCSGFTGSLYSEIYKKEIPRSSRDIYANAMPINKPALYEGDLVFFATGGGGVSHVGVYLWDGYFVHASTSKGVIVSRLREAYYKRTFVGGGAWLE
jgi:cell wall-associated NlpC family hydrolase